METKDWVPIVLSIVQTIYAAATFHRDKLKIWSRPTAIMAAFVTLCWAAVIFNHYDKPPTPVGAIANYGLSGEAFVATAMFPNWRDLKDQKAMLITRTQFADVDRPSDKFIGKSVLYSIEGPALTMATPMADRTMRFAVGQANMVEFNLIVLPLGVNRDQIQTLGDVARHGGKIISVAAQGGHVGAPLEPTKEPLAK